MDNNRNANTSQNSWKSQTRPTSVQLKKQLMWERYRMRYLRTLRSTVMILVCVAAIAVLLATLVFPVLQVVGTSMEPTLENGEVLVAIKNGKFRRGDIVAFYYNNKILLKRVIAVDGEYVEIAEDGTVSVNNQVLDEPYLTDKSLGECDIEMPYQVPDGRIFVMGDHRATSVDSRSKSIGAIADEYIVGRVIFRVWPLSHFGVIQ